MYKGHVTIVVPCAKTDKFETKPRGCTFLAINSSIPCINHFHLGLTNVFSITGHSSPIYVSVVFLVYVSEPQFHMTNEVRFEFQNSLSSPNSRNTS